MDIERRGDERDAVGEPGRADLRTVVYLDQNKWIDLSRAHHGGPAGARFKDTFEFLNDPGIRTRVVLPLSAVHYIETSRIGGNSQRRVRLGKTMWEVSGGATMASVRAIQDHEFDLALARRFPGVTVSPFKLVDRGVAHAFAMNRLAYHIPEQFRSRLPATVTSRFERAAQAVIEESLLTGVGPEDMVMPPCKLDEPNFKFMHHLETLHPRISRLPRTQWDDALFAFAMADILDRLNAALQRHGIDAGKIEGLGKDRLKEFITDIPTCRVDLQLHRQLLKNPTLKPRRSDLDDWGGLGPAAAHCDVIVCEKHFADLLMREGFTPKARVVTDLRELPSIVGV